MTVKELVLALAQLDQRMTIDAQILRHSHRNGYESERAEIDRVDASAGLALLIVVPKPFP